MIDVETVPVDLARAEQALAEGRAAEARALAEGAATVAGRGFLPEAAGAWVERRQAELRELHHRALETASDAAAAAGDWAGALDWAEEAVEAAPLRESSYLRLMTAHAGAGNRGEALRAYERCRRMLAEELGVSPSPSTEAAYVALLGEEPRGAAPPPATRGSPARPAAPPHPARGARRRAGRHREGPRRHPAAHPHRHGRGGQDPAGPRRRRRSAPASYADGACFVELAPLADPDLLPQQVLTALGLREETGQSPAATLAAHLRARHVLLVLDNCEHLVAAAATLAETPAAGLPTRHRAGHQPRAARGARRGDLAGALPLPRRRHGPVHRAGPGGAARLRRHRVGGAGARPPVPAPRQHPPGHRAGRGAHQRPVGRGDRRAPRRPLPAALRRRPHRRPPPADAAGHGRLDLRRPLRRRAPGLRPPGRLRLQLRPGGRRAGGG